ncbi:MAG: winged helix-turn-helix transcriptional regulator [Clostridia bacterium]|nr:winged helix-turn-helix transcriptional regulator [Clostridia bacterium]
MKKRKIGFELHRSSRIVKRYMDKDASKSYVEKITGTHGWVIGYLYNNRHRDIFQKDFEKEFNIRRSTASKLLSLMESNDLIKRESVPYDARLKRIVLTEKALEVQCIVEKAFAKMEEKIKEGITDEELEIFFRVLDKVNKNMERNDSEND